MTSGYAPGEQRRSRCTPCSPLVVDGLATQEVSRLLAKDKVASFLRAPFTRFQESSGHGELSASSSPSTSSATWSPADMLDTKVGAGDKDDPADVARDGFEALMSGKERAVSASLSTKLQGRGSRFLPDSAKAAMHRKMAEPGSGNGEG